LAIRRGDKALRAIVLSTLFVLPTLTLVPLGSLWLWENGYLLYWAGLVLGLTVAVVGLELWLVRKPAGGAENRARVPDAEWSDREQKAWQAADGFAESLTVEMVQSDGAFRSLTVETINRVARSLHPADSNPVWNFTVPEALALTERVSSRLRPVFVENVPLGDRLTVKQVLRLYDWRVAVDWAERAYDVWRILRLLNPATALASEARERLTKQVYSNLKDEFTVRLAQGYVREVARAAIELYAGRMLVEVPDLEAEAGVPEGKEETGRRRNSSLTQQTVGLAKLAARSLLRGKK
jgi:uncharacterized protein